MDEFLRQAASADAKEGKSNPLTVQEQEELLECEKAIRMSREGTVEAATALLRIRDRRLYRGSFRTFKDYCRHGWQMGSGYAYDLIKFALIRQELSAFADIRTLPICEAQTRPLSALNAADRATVWRRAMEVARGERITGKIVRRAREAFRAATLDNCPGERRNLDELLPSARPQAIECSDRAISLDLKLSKETLHALGRLARANDRTLSEMVSQILAQWASEKDFVSGQRHKNVAVTPPITRKSRKEAQCYPATGDLFPTEAIETK
jgi:hypothetical protein